MVASNTKTTLKCYYLQTLSNNPLWASHVLSDAVEAESWIFHRMFIHNGHIDDAPKLAIISIGSELNRWTADSRNWKLEWTMPIPRHWMPWIFMCGQICVVTQRAMRLIKDLPYGCNICATHTQIDGAANMENAFVSYVQCFVYCCWKTFALWQCSVSMLLLVKIKTQKNTESIV